MINQEQHQTGLQKCRYGIAMMQDGQLIHAVRQMRDSIATLQRDLETQTSDERRDHLSYPQIISVPIEYDLESKETAASPNNDFPLCMRCFDTNVLVCDDNEMVACVLMYNFAVAVHLHGISTGKGRHFQRAFLLYKKAKLMVESKWGDARYAHLTLALWTNLGHISSHLMMHEEVGFCRHNIRMLLETVPETCLSTRDSLFFYGLLVQDLGMICKNAAAA